MDQVYIPKRRIGFDIGTHVVIRPLRKKIAIAKPSFYDVDSLDQIKLRIVNEIFEKISEIVEYDNVIITGSFLEKGFNFNDIDILLISEDKVNTTHLEELLKDKIGVKVHIVLMDNKTLTKGMSSDPLYQTMLSRCVSIKRFVYRVKHEINYKILDLHLLKSKLLIENFDFLSGDEKYEMARNAVSIALFIGNKEVKKDKIEESIDKLFGKDMSKNIKENIIVDKKGFLAKYKKFYNDLSSRILDKIKNGSK